MIRIHQVKGRLGITQKELEQIVCKRLKIKTTDLQKMTIRRKSLDARKGKEIQYIYTIDIETPKEKALLKKNKDKNIVGVWDKPYRFPEPGNKIMSKRPVVVGSGPAGLFCAYFLAKEGFRPIVLERGEPVKQRKETVEAFWKGGDLNPESNVQFGEGGAGTFSDGKLNTQVKDACGRNGQVLQIFVEHGAREEILYEQKPHLGTDVLERIVANIRNHIITMGGSFLFSTKVETLDIVENQVVGVILKDGSRIETNHVVLAIGHSARDTFAALKQQEVPMEPKPFAVGVRMEHPQEMINENQYGEAFPEELPAADYKLTKKTSGGRGVYSFCMCPGGYVVNASSEAGRLAVNGMSYSGRDGRNANSAIVATVSPADFPSGDPLSGLAFQRELEERAYREGRGKIPIQLFGDFQKGEKSVILGEIEPSLKGGWEFGNLRTIFPEYINEALIEGITSFSEKMKGFAREDAVLSGVESRTSSPVRILREENMESKIKGLYPCGEGAGYAGGITSAAMDGIKVAEAIGGNYFLSEEI